MIHFLNMFPALLLYQDYGPTILRIALGLILLNFGWTKLGRQRAEKTVLLDSIYLRPGYVFVWLIGLVEIVSGVFLFVGFLTQVAALVSAIILLAAIYLKKVRPTVLESDLGFLCLCLVIALSLLLTGAGQWAIDFPYL